MIIISGWGSQRGARFEDRVRLHSDFAGVLILDGLTKIKQLENTCFSMLPQDHCVILCA